MIRSHHSIDQPRHPAGSSEGGRWSTSGGVLSDAIHLGAGVSLFIKPDTNLKVIDKFDLETSSSKAVIIGDDILQHKWKYDHLHTYTRLVLENPDQFPRDLVQRAQLLEDEGWFNESAFEAQVMEKIEATSIARDFLGDLSVVRVDVRRSDEEPKANEFYRDIAGMIERGQIDLGSASRVSFVLGRVFFSVDADQIDMVRRVVVNKSGVWVDYY